MSKRTELQKEFYKKIGNYKGDGKYNDRYVKWLEDKILADKQGKNLPIQSVSVSDFREIPISPMTDLEKQFNLSTHDAAIRTLKEMNIPQDLIEKKSNSR